MINEEISNKTLSIAVQEGRNIARAIWEEIKKLLEKAQKEGKSIEKFIQDNSSEVKLKDLVKKRAIRRNTGKRYGIKRAEKTA